MKRSTSCVILGTLRVIDPFEPTESTLGFALHIYLDAKAGKGGEAEKEVVIELTSQEQLFEMAAENKQDFVELKFTSSEEVILERFP